MGTVKGRGYRESAGRRNRRVIIPCELSGGWLPDGNQEGVARGQNCEPVGVYCGRRRVWHKYAQPEVDCHGKHLKANYLA